MDGYVQIGTKLDTKDFDAEIKYIESQLSEIEHKLKQADMGFEVGDTQKLEAQYSRLIKQLDRLQKKQADLNKTDLSNVQNAIENIKESTGKVISKIGKWALAIFGIRTAYNLVRNAVGVLSQHNEKIANDIEYIQFALASMLRPIVETLINLIYKLLTYINYVAQQWFGINLFANSSADAFNKADKNAKKLQKTMAGFDEMNVISDSGSSSSQGNMLPSFDLSKNQIEIPNWLKSIADTLEGIVKFAVDHPELIIGILGGAKLGGWLATIIGTAGGVGGIGATGLLGIATILAIIAGISIANVVQEFNKLQSELKNNEKMYAGTTKNVEELAEKTVDADTANKNFIKTSRTLKNTLFSTTKQIGEYKKAQNGRYEMTEHNKRLFEETINQEIAYKKVLENTYNQTDMTIEQTIEYIDYLRKYKDGLTEINTKLENTNGLSDQMANTISKNKIEIANTESEINRLTQAIGITAKEYNIFGSDIDLVNDKLGASKKIYDSLKSKSIRLTIDAEASKAESVLKNLFNNNLSRGIENVFKGIGLNIKLPKLAVGGIVNMPGRGVAIGGAITGERGPEGVIPLTNSQMMAELGQAIGRYVNINATVPVYVGNRQIAREIKKINADNDFAVNR